jgi:hypothetical protein
MSHLGHLFPCRQGIQQCPLTAALPKGTDAQQARLPTVKEYQAVISDGVARWVCYAVMS